MKKCSSLVYGMFAGIMIVCGFTLQADGFVRKREKRDYKPHYGWYQDEEKTLNDRMRQFCHDNCDGIPAATYWTMEDYIPGTRELMPPYYKIDLTGGGEFDILDDQYKKDENGAIYCESIRIANTPEFRQALIGTNEWLRPLEKIEPWPELKVELDRYNMRAYEIDFWGYFLGSLVYESHAKGEKLPIIFYMPGVGELGDNLTLQFHQHNLFDLITSKKFQEKHPCHFIALSPHTFEEEFKLGLSQEGFDRRAYRMLHKVGHEVLNDRVDWSRIYLLGFSYGASKFLSMAYDYPSKYAAGLFVSGMIPRVDLFKRAYGDKIPPMNIWYVANDDEKHEEADGIELGDYLNSHKGDFRMSFFPRMTGHNAWDHAWTCEELWDWLFSKKLKGETVYPVSMRLPNPVCSTSVEPDEPAHATDRVVDMLKKTYYAPSRPYNSDDWWQVAYSRSLKGKVSIVSGTSTGQRLLTSGYVEWSKDGKRWASIGVFSKKTGVCEFVPPPESRYLRVRVKTTGTDDFTLRSIDYYPTR